MPNDFMKTDVPVGEIVFAWAVKEYEQYERDRRWYLLMTILGGVLLVYAIIATNYLFALILVLFGIIIYLHELIDPQEINFAITQTGIILGRKFYRFNELTNFWIIYNPPEVKSLYFSTTSLTKHRLQVPLLDNDPRPIRDYLIGYMKEDLTQEEEPLSDRLARLLKLH